MNFDHQRGAGPRRLIQNAAALSLIQLSRIGLNTLLSLLIASRLGVEGFGKYGVVTAYLNISQVLATLGVHRLVVREMARRPSGGLDWFGRMVVSQVLGAGASAAVLILAANLLSHPADTTRALEVVACSLAFSALSSAAESAFQAREQMGLIALAQVVAVGVQAVGSAFVLLTGHGIVALAWMIVLGQFVASVIELGITKRMGLWRAFRVDLKGAIRLCRQSFSFYLVSLSVVVFSRLDVLTLSQMVGEEAVGLYTAAYLIVRVVNFISVSYSDAAYPALSRFFSAARAQFQSFLSKSLLFGTTITLLIAILVAAVAGPIIGLLYQGPEYAASATLLRIEAAFIVIFMWNALLSSSLMAGNLQHRSAVVAGAKLGAGVIYYLLLTAWLGVTGTAIATVIAGFTGTMLNYYFVSRELYPLNIGALVAKPLMVGAVLVVALWFARGLAWPGLVIGGTLLYVSLLVVLRVFSKDDMRFLGEILRPA